MAESPNELTIRLDLEEHLAKMVGYDEDGEPTTAPTTVEDLVLGLAANKLVDRILNGSRYGTSDDDPVRALRVVLADAARERAEERVADLVEEAFQQMIHQTSDDGTEVFSRTLREAIQAATERAVQLRESGRRNQIYAENRSVLEALVIAEVARAVADEVKGEIEKAKRTVRAEVQRRASEAIAAALTDKLTN